MSDVCGEDANDEEHKNQCGLLASVKKLRLPRSLVLNSTKSSSLCQKGVEKDQNTVEKVVLKMAKTGNREVHSELEESCVSPSEYGQTKPVKTRRPQKEQHVSRWSSD